MSANLKIRECEKVEEWLERLPRAQGAILKELRNLILENAPHLDERIKWSAPWYVGNDDVFYLACQSNYATFGVCNGAHLELKEAVLEGSGKNMRHVKVPTFDVASREKLLEVLKVAVAYDEALR